MAAAPARRPRPAPQRRVVKTPERAGVGWASTEPAPDERPARKPTTDRPPLRLVDEAVPQRALRRLSPSRRRRIVVLALSGLLALLLFALAATHAMLVTGQEHLDDLEASVGEAQADYSRTRRDVAALAAPDRIVAEALALGMVEPDRVNYLSPSDALAKEAYGEDGLTPDADSDGGAVAAAPSWSEAKPYLGTAP
jgi:hypothetical protein